MTDLEELLLSTPLGQTTLFRIREAVASGHDLTWTLVEACLHQSIASDVHPFSAGSDVRRARAAGRQQKHRGLAVQIADTFHEQLTETNTGSGTVVIDLDPASAGDRCVLYNLTNPDSDFLTAVELAGASLLAIEAMPSRRPNLTVRNGADLGNLLGNDDLEALNVQRSEFSVEALLSLGGTNPSFALFEPALTDEFGVTWQGLLTLVGRVLPYLNGGMTLRMPGSAGSVFTLPFVSEVTSVRWIDEGPEHGERVRPDDTVIDCTVADFLARWGVPLEQPLSVDGGGESRDT